MGEVYSALAKGVLDGVVAPATRFARSILRKSPIISPRSPSRAAPIRRVPSDATVGPPVATAPGSARRSGQVWEAAGPRDKGCARFGLARRARRKWRSIHLRKASRHASTTYIFGMPPPTLPAFTIWDDGRSVSKMPGGASVLTVRSMQETLMSKPLAGIKDRRFSHVMAVRSRHTCSDDGRRSDQDRGPGRGDAMRTYGSAGAMTEWLRPHRGERRQEIHLPRSQKAGGARNRPQADRALRRTARKFRPGVMAGRAWS